MRSLLIFCTLLLAEISSAQVYSQNEPPVQQVQLPKDCYTNNLDRGNAAMRRGDKKEALRFFKAARSCEEVQSNSRRLSELDNRISKAEEDLGIRTSVKVQSEEKSISSAANSRKKYSVEPPAIRRNYKASQSILNDTLEDCYQRMTEEADRAFRLKFWEDAAALYRAAKNCSDADQAARQLMSEKIIQCRNAAENELFAKQQEAERQARHAIAANLADDAQELLESSDRSLAFRLADFANQYVAPDDNPDCIQAIFDAWYYQPSENTLPHRNDQLHHPVFTYEIAENYGNRAHLKFLKDKNGNTRLWTFTPEKGEVNVRATPQFEVVQSISTGEDPSVYAFDVSPLEDILLISKTYIELRRGARQHRIYVDNVTNWCFSPRGDEILYENSKDRKIYLLNINQVFNQMASRKATKSANVVAPPVEPREMVSGIDPGLLALEYEAGKIWLGYSNRIEVLSKPEPGKPWKKEIVWFENVSLPVSLEHNYLKLNMFPEKEFAVLVYFNQTWIIPTVASANQQDSTAVFSGRFYNNLIPLAICPEYHQIAFKDTLNYLHQGFWLLDVLSGDTLTHQHLPDFSSFTGLRGAFSSDGAWIAAENEGTINIWALREAATKFESALPFIPDDRPLISADGSKLFTPSGSTLTILSTDALEPLYTVSGLGTPLRGASNDWVMIQVNNDSAEVRQLHSGKQLRFPLFNPDEFPFPYAFDSKGEKWVAFAAWDKVEVRSLRTGAVMASRKFDGGSISQIHAIPGKDELLLVLNAEPGTSSVKLWSVSTPEQKTRTMRLHQYSVNMVAIDPGSLRVALSDGNDIRIFDLQNIENEVLKLRSNKSGFVNALAFRPNSNLLAAAYQDGKVVFWNVRDGQPALKLQAVQHQRNWDGSTIPTALGFSEQGNRLLMTIANGKLLSYVLDPGVIRDAVQNDYRQLQAFSVDQIQEYNLESALYYPGNFERLAESNDAPLIRAFFQHFGSQAVGSNNIYQVRDYCEKALYLYERLNPNTQARWINEMAFMYKDYAWKLLLRGNIKESQSILAFIKKKFGANPMLLEAHSAMLQDDCELALKAYTRHFLGDGSDLQNYYGIRSEMEQAERELIQLRDYGLLDSTQWGCFCDGISFSGAFVTFCPDANQRSSRLSEEDLWRWDIFKNNQEAIYTFSFPTRQQLLEEALDKSRMLIKRNPAAGFGWLETSLLELGRTYHNRAGFEQNSPDADRYFAACHQLLTDYGAFKAIPDTVRLALLANNHLAYGRQLLNAERYQEALAQFNGGLEVMNKLWPIIYTTDSMLIPAYSDHLVGPLYEKLGTTYLLSGDTALARQAYEMAGIYMISYGLNTLYQGNLSALAGDEVQALADYGGIFNPDQTAEALFLMDRISDRYPSSKDNISSIRKQLIAALRTRNVRLVGPEADYWYAAKKQIFYSAHNQWDSTLAWSRRMLKSAKACTDQPKADESWKQQWLDAHISVAYYQLMAEWKQPASLEAVIQISREAETFLSDQTDFYYGNRELLKTNLAHAMILRNNPGDREAALELYRQFLTTYSSSMGYDNIDLLEKDVRDLKSVGVKWPDLPTFQQIQEQER